MPIRISAKTIDLDLLWPIATVHLVTLTIVREARHQTHSNQARHITSSSALFDVSAKTLVVESLVPSRQAPKHNAIQTQKSCEKRALSTWIASAATDMCAYTDLRRMTSGTLRAFNRRRATSTYANE